MVADIVQVFLDALTAMVSGVSGALIDIFETLVYNPTTGLTGIATYALVFGGISLVLGLINRFVK